ncbi:hypothetical protein TNCV_4552661 [Trichonephila clavipes]|nr:hypothetical protein TNCV_4552661 [Trichonephila clavipes]
MLLNILETPGLPERFTRIGVQSRSVSKEDNQLCVFPSTDDREETAYCGPEDTTSRPDSNELMCTLHKSQDSCRASTDLEIEYHQSNIVEKHIYKGVSKEDNQLCVFPSTEGRLIVGMISTRQQ